MTNIRRNFFKKEQDKNYLDMFLNFSKEIKFLPEISFLIALSMLCIFLYNFLIKWDYFKIDNIIVKGNIRLSKEKIIKCARLYKGINILNINCSIARKRLKANLWIADAKIKRILPSEIHIWIKEHNPVAIFNIKNNFLANNYGEVFKRWNETDPVNLPVVTGLKFSDINIGDEFHTIAFKAVMNVLQFGQEQKSVLPNKLIKTIKVDPDMGITLFMNTDNNPVPGRVNKIKLGYGNYAEKYYQLKKLLLYFEKQQTYSEIDSIDLNNLDRVVVKPMKTESLARDYKEV